MFGLMKRLPREAYCGTCKSLGAIYGQPARLLLSHDVAFLSEVLLDLAGLTLSAPSYRSFNCLSLPGKETEIPAVLQYTAAVNVVLAHFRIADHRMDAKDSHRQFAWMLAERTLASSYRQASAHLRSCDFPFDEMATILATQRERERSPQSPAHVAEPTMVATAMVFEHGVRLAGRPDRAADASRLGRKFGELIYLLDAYEDRTRDSLTGQFNAILAFPERYSRPAAARDEILEITRCLEREMIAAHAARLRVNVEERVGLRPRVLQAVCRQSLRDRLKDAVAFARSLRDREAPGFVKGAMILASVSAVAFLFPHYSRRAESWQECLGVSMNLMALGTMFAASPPPQPPRGPLPPGFEIAQPDKPGANIGDCRGRISGGCKDCCAEACIEGICDAICSG